MTPAASRIASSTAGAEPSLVEGRTAAAASSTANTTVACLARLRRGSCGPATRCQRAHRTTITASTRRASGISPFVARARLAGRASSRATAVAAGLGPESPPTRSSSRSAPKAPTETPSPTLLTAKRPRPSASSRGSVGTLARECTRITEIVTAATRAIPRSRTRDRPPTLQASRPRIPQPAAGSHMAALKCRSPRARHGPRSPGLGREPRRPGPRSRSPNPMS